LRQAIDDPAVVGDRDARGEQSSNGIESQYDGFESELASSNAGFLSHRVAQRHGSPSTEEKKREIPLTKITIPELIEKFHAASEIGNPQQLHQPESGTFVSSPSAPRRMW
jgi:hypothetical protein